MDDIAPYILELLENEFQELYEKNDKIKNLLKLINEGNATYEEANEYAIELGEMLAKCYDDCIKPEDLPDGKMYFNIAKRTVEPTMKNNFDLISTASTQVQKSLNDRAGIGLKVISPEINQYKIDSIINKVSSDQFEKVAFILQEPIVHFSQSIVDDTIKGNVELHSKSGLNPKITRKVRGGCCQWCMNLAGTYSYPDDVPDDVYRRHDHCRCEVLFDPGEGRKYQNVHSKNWVDKEEIEKRIEFSNSILGIENNTTYHNGLGITLRDEYKNKEFKLKVLESHKTFADKGWQSTEHFNKQLLGRLNSGRIKSIEDMFEVLSKPINYIDLGTHNYVKYYNDIGIVIDEINGELVTIIPRNNSQRNWVKKL